MLIKVFGGMGIHGRSNFMEAAPVSNLLQLKIVAEFNVFEGMPHGFIYDAGTPEVQKLYKKTADFFEQYIQ